MHLEVFSDSDWGSNKQHRKSVSAGYVCYFSWKCSAFLFEQDSTCGIPLIRRDWSVCCIFFDVWWNSYWKACGILHRTMCGASSFDGLGSCKRNSCKTRCGRIRHLSCRILWLQQWACETKRQSCTNSWWWFRTVHVVSGVSGSNNIADLGTKRLGKRRLSERMNFCNLGYIVGDTFLPFSEHVSDTKQMVALVKSLKKGSASVSSIIAHATLIRLGSDWFG